MARQGGNADGAPPSERTTGHGSRVTYKFQQGFTLLELVLVIVLALAIAVVLGLIASQGIRGGLAQAERRDMVKEGMEALEKMTRDIRMLADSGGVQACAANAVDADVYTATDARFKFSQNALGTSVCYSLESGTLWRAVGCDATGNTCENTCTSREPIARNVVNAGDNIFDYYRYNGATTAAACDIWRVQIELQLRRGTSTTDPLRNVTLRTSVFPRDLAER